VFPCGPDSVSVHDRRVTVEDDEYTLNDHHAHDQSKQPECNLVTSIRIIDGLGKKFIEHGSSFCDDELKRALPRQSLQSLLGIAIED